MCRKHLYFYDQLWEVDGDCKQGQYNGMRYIFMIFNKEYVFWSLSGKFISISCYRVYKDR